MNGVNERRMQYVEGEEEKPGNTKRMGRNTTRRCYILVVQVNDDDLCPGTCSRIPRCQLIHRRQDADRQRENEDRWLAIWATRHCTRHRSHLNASSSRQSSPGIRGRARCARPRRSRIVDEGCSPSTNPSEWRAVAEAWDKASDGGGRVLVGRAAHVLDASSEPVGAIGRGSGAIVLQS